MCGRYALFGPQSRRNAQFGVTDELDFTDRYNIAPTEAAPLVRQTADGRQLELARWGLLPAWAKTPGEAPRAINARAEEAARRPMFRHAFRHGRVLVPASGFYEWRHEGRMRTPHFLRPVGDEFFGLGGLTERWRGPEGEVRSFCILVTAANGLVTPLHDRMPVIIARADYDAWLDPALTDAEAIAALIRPWPPEAMRAYEVGREVNRPGPDHPGLVAPVA